EGDKAEYGFEFPEREHNRTERTQSLRPVALWGRARLGSAPGMRARFQFVDMITDPDSLLRLRRKQRQAGQPTFARLLHLSVRLVRPRLRRQLLHLIRVHQQATLWTLQRVGHQRLSATHAVLTYLVGELGHESGFAFPCIISY